MKKISLLLVLCLAFESVSAFAACEYEKERAERNFQLCETWGRISVTTAGITGSLGHALIESKWGWLAGFSGLVPGAVAFRVCTLAKEKEDIYQACMKNEAIQVMIQKDIKIKKMVDDELKSVGDFLGQVFMEQKAEYQRIAEEEFDAYVETLINSDRDINDPAVIIEMEQERVRINSQYF